MKAMIFAAGLGTRFKPWTDEHPKALAVVNSKSLLQRNIEYLQSYGIREVVVNVHHFSEQIIEAVRKNYGWGSNIMISDESDELLDTGGGLIKAKEYLDDSPFVTLNADILTDLDLGKMIEKHQQSEALITCAVTNRKSSRQLLFDQFGRLCGWRNSEKGIEKLALPVTTLHPMSYSCISIFQQQVFEMSKLSGKFSLIDLFLELGEGNIIMGYDHTGDKFIDVGKPDSVKLAERMFE